MKIQSMAVKSRACAQQGVEKSPLQNHDGLLELAFALAVEAVGGAAFRGVLEGGADEGLAKVDDGGEFRVLEHAHVLSS